MAMSLQKFIRSNEDVKRNNLFWKEISYNKYLYLMALPGILFFIVFGYLPLIGLTIAFQDFNPVKGILNSPFIGLKNFEFFFTSPDWFKVTLNTLFLNSLFIVSGLVASITIAIMFSEIKSGPFAKTMQSLVILPHFLSWTVISLFTIGLFASDIGFINSVLKFMHFKPISFYLEPKVWPFLLVILRLWQGAGFGSIVYLASIAGINPEIYESAKIDGASRLQAIFHITIPMLKSTAILLTLFAVGRIFYGDFGMIYAIVGDNGIIQSTTDVIDTFVYRALRVYGDLGQASAAGFYQSIVGFVMVLIFNAIAKKADPDSSIF